MFEFIYSIFETYKDFLTPILTGFFTLILFVAKEFWEARRAKRKERQTKLDIFGVYGYPLLNASKDLVERLFDILLEKPRYLQKDAPQTEYYKYHYISTLYRMSAVLGWVQAIRREMSKMEVGNTFQNQALEQSIKDFQTSLASNFFLLGQQVDYLLGRWGLKTTEIALQLGVKEKNKLERDIEVLTSTFMKDHEGKQVWEITKEEKIQLLTKIRNKLAESVEHPGPFDDDLIAKYMTSCIRVISRRVSWIYLDWQRGIGDFMLIENPAEKAVRRLELKSFQAYEDAYQAYREGKNPHRWIARVDRLFYDLQPGSSILYDMRDQQLEEVSAKLVSMIKALRNTGIGTDRIKQADLDRLDSQREKLEMRKAEEAEKMKASEV